MQKLPEQEGGKQRTRRLRDEVPEENARGGRRGGGEGTKETKEATGARGSIQADGNAREARTRRGEGEEDKKMRSGAGRQRGVEENGRETVKADRNSNPRTPPNHPGRGPPPYRGACAGAGLELARRVAGISPGIKPKPKPEPNLS